MKTFKFLSVLMVLVTLAACSKKSAADFDSDPTLFKAYIAGFTSGFIPAKSDIRVQLAFQKKDWNPEQELDDDLFSISPSVDGKVKMLSSNTIAFIPEEPLEQNTLYQVTLNLEKLTTVTDEKLQAFNFSFKTIKQDFIVQTQDLQSYNKNYYYQYGTIRTADEMDIALAQKILSATQNGNDLKVKIDKEMSSPTEFKFLIDSIQRYDDESTITLKWDGDEADVEDQEGSVEIKIPGKNQFKVVHITSGDENNQSILINFSDPLKKDQNFAGLVNIQNTDNLKFSTMGNVLKVYFDNVGPTTNTQKTVQNEVAATEEVAVDTVAVVADSTATVINTSDEVSDYEEEEEPKMISANKFVEVFAGIESSDGFKLKENYTETLIFDPIKPGVKLVKSGSILPSSNNLKVNFEAASLNAVDVKIYKIYKNNILQFLQDNELNGTQNLRRVSQPIAKTTLQLKQNNLYNYNKWNTYALDISKIIEPEPGAIYRVEFSFRKKYALYKCDGASEESSNEDEEEENEDDVNYSGGGGYYYYYEEDYNWMESQDPCSNYYYYNTKRGTNILATDLGVIVKRGNNKSVTVAVSNIVTTDPESGAKVELFNFQQQKLAETTTDGDGMATFELTKMAYFAVVSKGDQSTYVKLDDELSLSVSNFDVSGESLQKGLKGYIYGERGVWRPGDNVYLSFILNDNNNKLPENHPIKLRFNDPKGKTVYQTVQTKNELNHYAFTIPTEADAPTGNWEARISVGGAHFYKSIKIETIKPNRLKIKNSFNGKMLSAGEKNTNTVQVTWLHGAVAKNLKTEVQAKFSQQVTTFKGYSNYIFDDPSRNFSTEEIIIFSGKVNENGQVSIPINPTIQGQAPGMLRAAFITKVYEQGGDVSTDVAAANYSPYKTYVGIKAPDPNKYGLIETDKNNRYEIISVNENGNPVAVKNLEVRVYRLESRWWWDASNEDLSNYNTANVTTSYKLFRINTDASGRGQVVFSVPGDDWGRYLVRVIDPTSGHASGTTVFLDYPYWSSRSRNVDGDGATVLRFNTDKKEYAVGETAKVFLPSSEGGRALISIENGSKVLKTLWAKTKSGETTIDLPITADMAPNVYINVTLLQPHASTKNDAPIRMYGVAPIGVTDKSTVLQPKLVMPEVLKPEQTVNIKVSEQQGKAMTYTIAIVDEGLLDLTRFQTPNAWDDFYKREALGVRTWDIYNDVIGAYGGRVNQVFSIGGDADAGGGKSKKANRFKPVVVFLGPFKLEKGAEKTHQIKLPKYIGSVRTMVVAANAESNAYGSVEKTTPVRSPLMVLASFPRKVTPSEQVTLPVTLFAMENQVKNVTVQVKTSGGIVIAGKATQSVTFARPDEKMAFFNLKIANVTGVGKVQVIATSGKERSVYEIEVDIFNPNPVTTSYTDVVLNPNSSKSVNWKTFGIAGSNKAVVEISSMPTVDFGRRMDYLIQYPHGCVEQTTSSVFPQLYLMDIMDLDTNRKNRIQRNVAAGIQRLSKFQTASGGMSYWPGSNYADDWGSSYAGHFMLEAEKKGYALPPTFKAKWIAYQQRAAKQWRFESHNDMAQAYRLYTLALAGNPDLASMNRLRETRDISNEAKLRLAATFALLKQNNAGMALLSRAKIDEEYTDENYYDYYYGSRERNRAMALETLILLGQKAQAFQLATKLAKNMASDEWMSTQTSAYCLYAMSKFAQSNGGKGMNVNVIQKGKSETINSAKSLSQRTLVVQNGSNNVTLKNNLKNTLFVRVYNSGILPVGKEKPMENNVKASLVFKDRKGNKIDVSKITQGTEFIAVVNLTNLKNDYVENIALTQIIPSGFEIVNTRYTEYGNATENTVDYMDIRDDRANYYFGLKGGETRTFKLLLNASYLGKYYLPGLQCEAMYDHEFIARTKGQWVEVVNE
ncbi:MG2 domain-containing protein [Flavobacterium sp.]|uniref:alpha-2-macroglobulin family protein n=1 Tax=Flavobacterium sp. TaxID=239 RepID=UPI0022C0FF6C|nr:MG2 domain-containing protein [Flavobacterium sp.]MCZ8169120.1 MG2 domain-containing protein [Flavobacterium sp.]